MDVSSSFSICSSKAFFYAFISSSNVASIGTTSISMRPPKLTDGGAGPGTGSAFGIRKICPFLEGYSVNNGIGGNINDG